MSDITFVRGGRRGPATVTFNQYQEVASGFTNPFSKTYTLGAPTGYGRIIIFGGYFRIPSGTGAPTSVLVNGVECVANRLGTLGGPRLYWASVPDATSVTIEITTTVTINSASLGLWITYGLSHPPKVIGTDASSTNNTSVQTLTLDCLAGGLCFALSRVTSTTARGCAWTNLTERWDEAAAAAHQSSGAEAVTPNDGTIAVSRQLTGAADTSTDWWAITIR